MVRVFGFTQSPIEYRADVTSALSSSDPGVYLLGPATRNQKHIVARELQLRNDELLE